MKKIALALALVLAPVAAHAQTTPVIHSGYVWNDDPSIVGKVSITVNIDTQMVYVYRGSTLVAYSHVSTGKPGHDTPTGVFPIRLKKENHTSSIYGSQMPFMQRLTNDGVALHAGNVTYDFASHGCVRLPLEFSKLLFSITKVGDIVTIKSTSADFDRAFEGYFR